MKPHERGSQRGRRNLGAGRDRLPPQGRPLRADPSLVDQLSGARTWKLEDAKAQFSEVVRQARAEGPQIVTVRGRDPVVVITAEEFERLQAARQPRQSFVDFMAGLHVPELDLSRSRDTGRDLDL